MAEFGIDGDHAGAIVTGSPVYTSSWHEFCKEAVSVSGLHAIEEGQHHYPNGDQVSFFVLSESAFVGIRTGNQAIVNCYTCGEEGQPKPAVDLIIGGFNNAAFDSWQLKRGDIPAGTFESLGFVSTKMAVAVSDLQSDRAFTDEEVFTLLHSSVLEQADPYSLVVLKKPFEPQGLTAVMVFQVAGVTCYADLHTYPEHNYRSVSVYGPAGAAFAIASGMEDQSVVRGRIELHPVRDPEALRLVA